MKVSLLKYKRNYTSYMPRFHEFPNIKTLELMSWSRSYFSIHLVLISLHIKHRNKGGAFICQIPKLASWRLLNYFRSRNIAYSRAAINRVASLNRSFTLYP